MPREHKLKGLEAKVFVENLSNADKAKVRKIVREYNSQNGLAQSGQGWADILNMVVKAVPKLGKVAKSSLRSGLKLITNKTLRKNVGRVAKVAVPIGITAATQYLTDKRDQQAQKEGIDPVVYNHSDVKSSSTQIKKPTKKIQPTTTKRKREDMLVKTSSQPKKKQKTNYFGNFGNGLVPAGHQGKGHCMKCGSGQVKRRVGRPCGSKNKKKK